jgi:hypothetical protein
VVTEVKIPQSFRRALLYNERKMELGRARLIHAGNFLQLPHEMDFNDKFRRFEKLMRLNDVVKTKTIHISLNFHPSEKDRLDAHLLAEISEEYMKKIGFEKQPFLVYEHHDAGHPHMHIVSTLIRPDGSRIHTHNIGTIQSREAAIELEKTYGLASGAKKERVRDNRHEFTKNQARVQKLQYGKTETRKSMAIVLNLVINEFKYTSLPELNAVLRQYNMKADRGPENGKMYRNRGLIYRALDDNGNRIGVPVNASHIDGNPTLKNLEKKFLENELSRQPELRRLRNAIDWTLVKPQKTLGQFIQALEKEQVSAIMTRDKETRALRLTYIDYQTKSVIAASELGNHYSEEGIYKRLGIEQSRELDLAQKLEKVHLQPSMKKSLHLYMLENELKKENEQKTQLELSLEMIKPSEESNEKPTLEKEEDRERSRSREQSPGYWEP